ncbi:reverse transcriptase domain-containing protein [Tanacetum coccineum]
MPKFALTLKNLDWKQGKIEAEFGKDSLNETVLGHPQQVTKDLGGSRRFLIPANLRVIHASIGRSWLFDFEPNPDSFDSGRCFLKTSHALIDVYGGEITFVLARKPSNSPGNQTSKYTADYDHMTANKIDVIEMACDEYSQEVLGFSNVIASGNPTPYFEPIVSTASPTLTPFGDSDFLLFEEADSFLALEDDPTSSEVDPTYQDPEGDILILEAILNSEPPPPSQIMNNICPEVGKNSNSVKLKPLNLPLMNLLRKTYLNEATRKVQLPCTIHGSNVERLAGNDILFPRWLSGYFQMQLTHKIRKDNLHMPIRNLLPMSHAFLGDAMLRTMNEAQTHYTTTEKELLAVVYAFEKFRSYLVMSKSIVYTDHSAIKYLFAKRMKARSMRGSIALRI